MQEFDRHSLNVLEYDKIISLLRGLCLTSFGVKHIALFSPTTDIDCIRIRQNEVTRMKDIIRFGESFPLTRADDITVVVNKSKTEGAMLDAKELLKVNEVLRLSTNLHGYYRDDRESIAEIAVYLKELSPFPELRKEIEKAIDPDGYILDSASSELKKIRADINGVRSSIVRRLDKLLAQRKKSPGWQDDTVMQREGRYVIPVVSGQYSSDLGIVHDRSQSGATLYVEPGDVVDSNNRLGMLLREERYEIERILKRLTKMVGDSSHYLLANCEIIGILDSLHASSNLSINLNANKPVILNESSIKLKNAFHPLLFYYTKDKKAVVPNDFELNDSRQALIITGPNTGGKTVALKTAGLLILMAQTGLHIPADEVSEVGIFDNVFADIGDEQSIELSLSTFSSHIRKIINAVNHANENSLILFDEIGAGTDPKEGSALAEAILLKLVSCGCKAIVTTHYSQLKTLPMLEPSIENASFEFDRDSLRPTYRLHIGIPGASYAVEIAERLGMPQSITSKAAELVGTGERSLTGLIESLEKELSTLRADKIELEDKLKSAAELEETYKDKSRKIKEEADQVKKEYIEEIERTLNDTRKNVERLVKDIRESKASKESVQRTHRFLKDTEERLGRIKTREKPKKEPISSKPEPGDRVMVQSVKKEGEFVEYVGNKKARVRVRNILMTVGVNEIAKIAGAEDKSKDKAGAVNLRETSAPGPEIHLRGMTVDEATEALDKFLDSAVLTGMQQVYVVHGVGTGALRKAMGQFLKKHPSVDSIRLGNWNEGGAGVTVVRLK